MDNSPNQQLDRNWPKMSDLNFVMKDGCIAGVLEMYSPMSYTKKDGSYGGACIEVLDMLMTKYGFCYTLRRSPDGTWGNKQANGSWSGMIGLAERKEVEFITCPVGLSYTRNLVMDFSIAVDYSDYTIVYPRPMIEANYAGFMLPFSIDSWIAIFVTGFLITTLTLSAQYLISSITGRENKQLRSVLKENLPAPKSWAFSEMVNQPIQPPTGSAGRILVGFWVLLILILNMTYKCNLKAQLIVPKVKIPFDNLAELVDQKVYKWSFMKGSFIGLFIKPAFDEDPTSTLGKTWGGKGELYTGANKISEFVIEKNYACLSTTVKVLNFLYTDFSKAGKCRLAIASEKMMRVDISFGLKKKSNLRKLLNPMLQSLTEFGIMGQLMRPVRRNATYCQIPPGKEKDYKLRKLAMEDCMGMFFILGAGFCISCLTFVLETISNLNVCKNISFW